MARGAAGLPPVLSTAQRRSGLTLDSARAKDAAAAMKITAQDLIELRVIDDIIAEPIGGAHREPAAAIATVGAAVAQALDELTPLSPEDIRAQRRDRFLAIGRFEAENAPTA